MSLDPNCPFCRIIASAAKADIVYEDDFSIGFLDVKPLLKGHCLLVPKDHIENFLVLRTDDVGPFFSAAQKLGKAIEKGMQADGLFTAINTRVSQSVEHLHIHLVPRWKGDGLFSRNYLWKRQLYPDEDFKKEVRDKIVSALTKI